MMQAGIRTTETLFEWSPEDQYFPAGVHSPHFVSLLAILHAGRGNRQESLNAIERAKEMIVGTGEYLWHSDVLRIEGELELLSGSSAEEVEVRFVHALAVARQQHAKSFELRAAMSMARLWRDQGKRQQARELLAPVYDWFTEGFDTVDLKHAKALLDDLSADPSPAMSSA